jgi:ferredoxin
MSRRPARLLFDGVRCDGVGICMVLAPDLLRPDSWGYPLISDQPHDKASVREAKRAVRACPHKALSLE